MPISYDLVPIYELFTSGYISQYSNIEESEVQAIYDNLVYSSELYCNYLVDQGVAITYCG